MADSPLPYPYLPQFHALFARVLRAKELHLSLWMFVNEFFFSFTLLLFTTVLFVLGMALLIDGIWRLLRTALPQKKAEKTAAWRGRTVRSKEAA